MIIVPVDREGLKRGTWVTYALVAVNILFFLMFCIGASDSDRAELMRTWQTCITYLRERPYLRVPPHIVDIMPRDVRDRVPRPDPNVPDWRASKEQDTIDEMAPDLYKRYRAVADIRMAFIPAIRDPFTILTSMFLHGGLFHLLGNMIFLLAIGPFVEEAYGRVVFTILYFSGGVVATLGFAAMHPALLQPLVGASGAIAAVMGAYLFRFALSHIDFLFIPIVFLPGWNFRFSLRAIFFLPVWLLEQLVSIPMESDSGVAVTAHVAGFIYGFAFVLLLRVVRLDRRPAPAKASAAQDDTLIVRTRRELDIALFEGHPETADSSAARLLTAFSSSADSASARALILELKPVIELHEMPQFITRAASFAERTGDRPQAIALLERLCDIDASAAVIPSLVKLGTLRRAKGDVAGARDALTRALAHPQCSDEWRRRIDAVKLTFGV